MGILTVCECVSWPLFLVAAALLVLSVYRYNEKKAISNAYLIPPTE